MEPGSRKSVPSRGKDGARSHSRRPLSVILQLGVSARKAHTPRLVIMALPAKNKTAGSKKYVKHRLYIKGMTSKCLRRKAVLSQDKYK
jgi:hypothetical protein